MHCRVWLQSERGCLHAFGLTRAFLWGEACRERLSQMSERPDVFSQRTSMNQNGHERPSYTLHLNNAICTTVHISSSGCLCTSCKFKLQILKSHKLITPALVDLSCCDGLQADSKQLRSTSNLHWWLYPEKNHVWHSMIDKWTDLLLPLLCNWLLCFLVGADYVFCYQGSPRPRHARNRTWS